MKLTSLITAATLLGSLTGLSQPANAGVKWPAGQLLPSFDRPAHTQDLISMPPAGVDPETGNEEQVLFSSLKGVVNRTKPRIWVAEGTGDGKSAWLKELGLAYMEVPDPWTLITKYRSEIAGVVVYDDTQPDTINLASSIAGEQKALVASPGLVSRLTGAPYNLPVLVDLRGKFTGKLAVYQYLYDHVWPQLPHRILIGLNPSAVFGSLREYAVSVNSAVVWLDPTKADEKALLDRFFASMGPGTVYLGWWPEEGSGVTAASAYGIVTCASDWSTNLSNFSGMSRHIAVKPVPPVIPPVQNKIYLAFIMSDGDNLQYCEHQLKAMWENPDRGKVPMGWTMSPVMLDAMPGALNYYYKTATPNDCLLSGPSGYGYTYPNDWTDTAALGRFISKSDDYCRRAGFRIITIWNTINGGIDPNVGAAYAADAPSLLGITSENAGAGLTIYGDKLPSFALTATYCGVMEQLTKEIAGGAAGWDGSSPRFLIIQAEPWHGLTSTDFVNLVKTLNSHFVVVRPDTIFQMMRSVHSLSTEPNGQPEAVGGVSGNP
ncbi:MAG: GxGYxYP domain-containing protein [Capsulimonadaceae bacterium]